MVLARQLLARQIVRHDSVRNHTMTSSLRHQDIILTDFQGKYTPQGRDFLSKFKVGGGWMWMEPNYPKPFHFKGPIRGYVKGSPYRIEHEDFVTGKLEGNPLNPWSQERSRTQYCTRV